MYELQNQTAVVIGLEPRGAAACRLLQNRGAKVLGVDEGDTETLRAEADELRALGIEVRLGVERLPDRKFTLAVASSNVTPQAQILWDLIQREVPVISELELGYQQSRCLNIAVAGTNGKGTTGELIERVLERNNRKTVLCGHGAQPICTAVPETKELDYLILNVNVCQLELTRYFRPAVAVLLNLTPDYLDRYGTMAAYVRAMARLFENQQAFDWAIVQSEALAELLALDIPIPAKIITFSASNRRADIFLDRGLLVSRLPGWSGHLLDMAQCKLNGMHNAENLMAALAVGHVLRMPLDTMVDVLKSQTHREHRFETVAEINGVKFIDDSKATNVDALHKALLSVPPAPGGEPNVWLIAGGRDKSQEYHYLGPLISQRVKGAFLIGEAREKLRASWSLFTPCAMAGSLLEAVIIAAKNAAPGDVILLSPACSSFDQFRNYQHRGEVFRKAANELAVHHRKSAVQPADEIMAT